MLMFERIQEFFQELGVGRPDDAYSPDDPRVAFAALCFQVMEADGSISDKEKLRLEDMLRERYQLDKSHLDSLMEAGRSAGRKRLTIIVLPPILSDI